MEASELVNRHSNLIACNSHGGYGVISIGARIVMSDIPSQKIGRQVQTDSGRSNDKGSLASKGTHEKSQLKNHIIPNSFVLPVPDDCLIVGRKNKYAKIIRSHRLKQALKPIGADIKDSLRPDFHVGVVRVQVFLDCVGIGQALN